MRPLSLLRFLPILVILVILVFAGCSIQASPSASPSYVPQPVVDGTLTVDWSINGSKDPNACNQSAVSAVRVVVTTRSGAPAGTFEQGCATFATSIRLPQGEYNADALLLDSAGHARTTAVAIRPFTILGNDELKTPIDFPASSFD